MLTFIEGLPSDVLAIQATGNITHADYRDKLIPKAEALIAKGPIRILYVVDHDFSGFELEALWDDSKFGLKHWNDFSHIAVVADQTWLRNAVSMFTPLISGEVRLFKLSELSAAKAWIGKTTVPAA
jgi:hypothetical protein